jgi:hypothetical protein
MAAEMETIPTVLTAATTAVAVTIATATIAIMTMTTAVGVGAEAVLSPHLNHRSRS